MDTKPPEMMSIRKLLGQKFQINREYQRGRVWNDAMKKRLVDSIMRRYPLPVIYLLRVKNIVLDQESVSVEVIDGQQRLDAIRAFCGNGFALFDPSKDREKARFPRFIEKMPCPWAGKNFKAFGPELENQFLDSTLPTVVIERAEPNEARDLFIRLQAGLPLNSQEKRDAWPGGLPDYVKQVAGHPDPEVTRQYGPKGHPFFALLRTGRSKARMKGASVVSEAEDSRGKYRQLCAGWLMMLIGRWSKERAFMDITNSDIDDFYYNELDFSATSDHAERFERVLDKASDVLTGKVDGKRLKAYEVLHLLLAVDELMDDYAPTWEESLPIAFKHFRKGLAEGNAKSKDSSPPPYWTRFGQYLRAGSESKDSIERRHGFFVRMIYDKLDLKPLDESHPFGALERELIWYLDDKKCQTCSGTISWSDLDVHHIEPYRKGGTKSLSNGAAVHRKCHPKGEAAEKDFARKWKGRK